MQDRIIELTRNRCLTYRRGQIAVMAALMMIVIFGFAAFAIDVGFMCLTRDELQNAADAAALAGTLEIAKGEVAVRAAAKIVGELNFTGKQSVTLLDADILLGRFDKPTQTFTAGTIRPNAVRVVARTANRKLYFAPLFGNKLFSTSAMATAMVKTSRCGLIIGIPSVSMSGSSRTDSYDSSLGRYSSKNVGHGGHVCTNGNITMSGSTCIDGDAHPGPEKVVKSSSSIGVLGTIAPLAKPVEYPAVDPGDAATNNDNSSIPLSALIRQPLQKGAFKLSGGDSVALPPGKYYFESMTLSGGSSISISGETIIYVSGKVDLSGGSVANLTYQPKNFQLFPMGSTCVLSGSSELYGVVYGPTTAVTRSGSSDFFGAIIGGTLVLSGSGGIHADESLDSTLLKGASQGATLVE